MSVLVAVDDSEIADEVAAAIAPYLRRSGTVAHLVTVIDPSRIERVAPRSLPDSQTDAWGRFNPISGGTLSAERRSQSHTQGDHAQAIARSREERLASLHELAARHLQGLEYEAHVESSRNIAQGIVESAKRLGADTIAIGTHGRSGLRHVLLGSVAEAVIRTSDVPVFVVRHQAAAPS